MLVYIQIKICLSQEEMQVGSVTSRTHQLIEGFFRFLLALQFSVADALNEEEVQIVLLPAGQGLKRLQGTLVFVFHEVA